MIDLCFQEKDGFCKQNDNTWELNNMENERRLMCWELGGQ